MHARGRRVETRRIWRFAPARAGQADRIFLEQHQIGLSSADVDDDMSQAPATRDAFKEAVAPLVLKVAAGIHSAAYAGQLYRFVHEMRIGDCVIYPRKSDRLLHWGEIIGPYVF